MGTDLSGSFLFFNHSELNIMSKKVACGEFVKRQTKDSGYSHYDGEWEELESLVENTLNFLPFYVKPGYRDGVCLVDLPPGFFYSAIVELNEDSKLTANYAPRREGEAPFIRVSAKAKKQPAKYASVVLYRHDVLEENNERETDAEWEIVAIKARVSEEEEPMDPYTMARNFLHLKGGTQGDFTAEQFAKSIVYWNSHVMCQGKPKWYKRIMGWLRQLRIDLIAAGRLEWETRPNRMD
jgi:hypothetical protein